MIVDIPEGFDIPKDCFRSSNDRPTEYECDRVPKGWQVTSPKGYNILRKDISEKRAELAKLRRQRKESKVLQE